MRTRQPAPAPRRPILQVSLVAAVVALGWAACGTAATGGERDAVAGQGAATAVERTVGPVRAIRLATAAVKGGRVFDIELDRERGRLVWELDVASSGKAYDVKLDARSGKVLRLKRDRTPDRGMRLLKVAKVRAVKAVRTATAAVKGANLRALELDRWRGRVVWEGELVTTGRTEYDVNINARTGKVVSKKIDD